MKPEARRKAVQGKGVAMSTFGTIEVADKFLEHAHEQAFKALQSPKTPGLLAKYYDSGTNYAGSAFAILKPNVPVRVTAVDLLATSTLSVRIPPRAVHRFLTEDETAHTVSQRLTALPKRELGNTGEADFALMADFYDLVKACLSRTGVKNPNPWVTASKLCARKRPDLFPVRDRVVCKYLGILSLNDRARDWFVFRHLIRDSAVKRCLEEHSSALVAIAGDNPRILVDQELLRLLDGVLWMYATEVDGIEDDCSEE